ncbi:MAG TPA: hypothetical protein VIL30_12710, partial [Ramlibacter sp.]
MKASLLDLLYQLTVKKWIINVGANLSGTGGTGGTGVLGSLASSLSGGSGGSSFLGSAAQMGGQYLSGGMSLGNAAGSMYANATGTGIDGLLATNGAYGTASGAGGLAAAGSMVAAAGAIAAAAYAVYDIWNTTRGENRAGATFGYANGKTGLVTQSAGDRGASDVAVKALVSGTVSSLNATFKAIGSKLSVDAFNAGWEGSKAGRGGVFAGGTLSNGSAFGESGQGTNYSPTGPFDSKYETWLTKGSKGNKFWDTDGDPKKLAVDVQQAFIAAIQASVGLIPKITKQVTPYTYEEANGDASPTVVSAEKVDWIRTFDSEMKERARDLGLLPKRILDLIINVDPETLSAGATKKLTDKITTLVGNVNGFRAIVENMPFEKLKKMSFDAAAGLVEVAGGLESLQTNLGTYYANFYSDEEKRDQVAGNISGTLKGVGLNLSPEDILGTSREEFRDMVEKYEGSTSKSGQRLYTTLLSVAGAFASLTEGAETFNSAQDEAAARARAVADERLSIEDRYFALTASGTEQLARQRERELAGTDKSNRSLLKRIYALEDEAAAADKANDIAAERQTLDDRYYALTHTSLQTLARSRSQELSEVDGSNRALLKRIHSLEDEKVAADKANEVAAERLTLDDRHYALTHSSGQVLARTRKQELAGVDASNRALLKRIHTLEDEAAAAEKAKEVTAERQTLDDRYYALTHTSVQVLARTRKQELAGVDASNRALLKRIHTLEDEATATEKAKEVSAERQTLDDRYYALTHNSMQVLARVRRDELAGVDATNRELLKRIHTLEDEKAAADKAKEVASERLSLDDRYYALTRNSAQVLARTRKQELAGVDETNRALLKRIHTLEDEAAAADKAKEVAAERQTLDDRYYALSHNSVQVLARTRKQELAGVDASNRALLKRIHTLEDEKAAADKAKEVAQQRQSLDDRLYSLTHTSLQQVARARKRELQETDAANRPLLQRIHAL